MQNPHVKTALPGPRAKALLERDAAVSSPSYPRDYPFVMSHGKGAEAWDVDGNRFLDFAAGIAVCSTGHSHPAVVQAVKDAADQFLHISSDYWHERQVRLGEVLNELNPVGEPAMTFLCQSGTEAVEGALKLARYVTGRPRILAFLGGFHGRTMGSLACTASKHTMTLPTPTCCRRTAHGSRTLPTFSLRTPSSSRSPLPGRTNVYTLPAAWKANRRQRLDYEKNRS